MLALSGLSRELVTLPINWRYQVTRGSILFFPQLSVSQLKPRPRIRFIASALSKPSLYLQKVTLTATNLSRLISFSISIYSEKVRSISKTTSILVSASKKIFLKNQIFPKLYYCKNLTKIMLQVSNREPQIFWILILVF